MLPNVKPSNGSSSSSLHKSQHQYNQVDNDDKNGKENRSFYSRILLLCCKKELLCYYVGFWLLVTLSVVGWTRSNIITKMISKNIQLSSTMQQQQTSVITSSYLQHGQQPPNYKQSQPGYRFVLNQTVEDLRIKAQYAAKSEIPLCRRYQIITGQWLSVQYEKPPYITSVKHLRCYPAEVYRQSPWHTYTWMPDMAAVGACTFDEYNTNDLCTLLPRGTISIIGDSLSWEQYRSLIQLHNVPTRQGYQFQSFELHTNIQQAICDGGITSVVYRRDDYLQNVQQSIDENFPTVLILNRGAHYVPDDQLVSNIKSVIKIVQKWLKTCETEYKMECHFFWRTTVPGHVGCNVTGTKISTPVYDLHDIEKRLIRNKSLYNDVSLEYHWYDFQHQNELVLDLFRKADLSNFQVIDAYYVNVLRPDEHRAHDGDCLHSCYPGKMDVYNRLLLHYLKMQRSRNDIKRLQTVASTNDWPINVNTEYNEDATNKAREKRLADEQAALQGQQQQDATGIPSDQNEVVADKKKDKDKDNSKRSSKSKDDEKHKKSDKSKKKDRKKEKDDEETENDGDDQVDEENDKDDTDQNTDETTSNDKDEDEDEDEEDDDDDNDGEEEEEDEGGDNDDSDDAEENEDDEDEGAASHKSKDSD